MTSNNHITTSGRLATIFFAFLASFSAVAAAVGPAIA